MKIFRQRFGFALLLCIGLAANASGQSNEEALLNRQLGSFQLRFEQLMQSRGATWYHSGTADVSTLAHALRHYGSAVLFYHFEHDTLHSWLIDASGLRAHAVSRTTVNELQSLERDWKWQLQNKSTATAMAQPERGADALNTDAPASSGLGSPGAKLASLLLPREVLSQLKDEHLLVVPELNIAAIPFNALQPFGDSTYIIDKLSISFAYSIDEILNRIYFYCEKNHFCETSEEMVFTPSAPLVTGNPDFSGCDNKFNPLKGAEQEANYAASILRTSALTGKEASRKNITDRVRGSEFMYFATHGVADADDPLNKSCLVFAGDKSCEYWTAKEIQFDTLKTEAIVVLSACQTGLGKTHEGGIIGLSRAFIKAGAGNVIMSLWSVNDEATAKLMHLFMDELTVPQSFFPADNLRQAVLKFKQHDNNPAHWAAFANMGAPYPVGAKVHLEAK
jgi:hypothetical protein